MARKSIINRNIKRAKLVEKYQPLRDAIKLARKQAFLDSNFEEILKQNDLLSKLPRDSSRSRLRNRCAITGRSRGYRRIFGLCRNKVRELGFKAPGVIKI